VRLAVAALLHQPSLALDIEPVSHLENCDLLGVPLLLKIINTWKQEPELTHAALIERFRGQAEEQQIQKLMSWNPPELAEPKAALEDALAWISRKTQNLRVQELIDKESTDGLTEDERQEFKNLLHQKAS
jgi:DNA primase